MTVACFLGLAVAAWLLSGAVAGFVYLIAEEITEGCLLLLAVVIAGAISGPAFWLLTAAAYRESP